MKKIVALLATATIIAVLFPVTAYAATFMLNSSDAYYTFDFAARGVQDGDVIVIDSGAQNVRLLGSSGTTYNNVTINIESSGNTNFIIENLNIACGGHDNTTPIIVNGPNNEMEVRGTCNLTSQYSVGIQVESGDELTIKGSGKLVVKGTTNSGASQGGAGIGGRYEKTCGTVNITDCNVTAVGGRLAAGIGGGGGHFGFSPSFPFSMIYYPGGAGGTVNISGNAVVFADGRAADIGGGYQNNSHGSLNISGNAAVFFAQSQDSLVSGFSFSSSHNYYNSSYKFNYTVGGTPASSITPQKLMRITSSSYNATSGVLTVVGESFTVGDQMDVSCLTISGEGGSYTLTSPDVTASTSTAFSVPLNSEDKVNINGILDTIGTTSSSSTTYNLSASSNWNASQGADADTTNGITVSGVLTPTITSAVYNAYSGELTVTGTNMVKRVGASNDIDISLLTITGEGSPYTITSTNDVEILSSTSFKLTLTSVDKSNIDARLDQIGTISSGGTTYNIGAADDWNGTGGNIADVSGNAIQVVYIEPTPAPTPTPTPTSAPTATPLSTAVPTSTPGETVKPTSTSQNGGGSNDKTATPTPSTTLAPTLSATPEAAHTSAPTGYESAGPTEVPSPQKTTIPAQVTPGENGKNTVVINVSDLPIGTKYIVMPDGSEIEINGEETITVEVSEGDFDAIEIIALGEDKVALGAVGFDLPVADGPNGVPLWIFFLAGGVLMFWSVYLVQAKKRRDFNRRNRRI